MVILSSVKFSDAHKKRLQTNFPNETFIFRNNMAEAKEELRNAHVFVTYGEDLNDELIKQATELKWIMVMSAGMDKMPFASIHSRGILVTNARGIHKIPMSEYAISMLLQVYRQEKLVIANEAKKTWDRSTKAQEITGKTMVVVGPGAIGKEVARLAKAFRMKTYGISRSGRTLDYFDGNYTIEKLDEFLPEADFIVSVLPSTGETRHLFTYEHFQKMRPSAVFLNMGRGDVVAGEVLLKAIREKVIAHAVLDVFEEEPLPAESPFWEEENITVTPHLSGISPHYLERSIEIFETNLQHFLKGDNNNYINKIDVTRGY